MEMSLIAALYCQITTYRGDHIVGKICKQWTGLVGGKLTDADSFEVSCK